jgi:hypothetical protein
MPAQLQIGQQLATLVLALDLGGVRRTGLTASDFSIALARKLPGGAWDDAPESCVLVELSSSHLPGQYEVRVTPATIASYVLEVTPTFAGASAEMAVVRWDTVSTVNANAPGTSLSILYRAIGLDGQPVTGLTAASFAREVAIGSSGTWSAAPTVEVTVSELSASLLPGLYEIGFVPATAGDYSLTVTPVFPGNSGYVAVEKWTVSSTATVSGLCTLADVRMYIAYGASAKDDALIEQLIGDVTALLERMAGRAFGRAYRTHLLSGGGRRLVLPVHPVETAGMVVTESTAMPRAHDSATPLTDASFLVDEEAGILERASGSIWAAGMNAVRVRAWSGYGTIPADVRRAAVRTVALWVKGRDFIGAASASGPDGSIVRYDHDRLPWDVKDTIASYRTPVIG